MPTRAYNTFFKGLAQDDFLTGGPSFIDAKNVDGINNGYSATLGPKLTNQLDTGVNAMRGMYDRSSNPDDLWIFGDNGTLYETDGTLLHTLAATDEDFVGAFVVGLNYYFITKFGVDDPQGGLKVYSISISDALAGTWTNLVDTGFSGLGGSKGVPPIIQMTEKRAYFGIGDGVAEVDDVAGLRTNTFSNDNVMGLTLHGTQFKAYSYSGTVYYFGVDITKPYTSSQNLGFRVARVTQEGNFDYITTTDGDLWKGSGYDYIQISKKRCSNRLEDNSGYKFKFDFTNQTGTNLVMTFARGDMYTISSDSDIGLYKYGQITPQLPKGFNKIVTQTHDGTEIDEIYTTFFHDRSNRLFISYRAGSTYATDYIDLTSKDTAKDGYLISEVFSAGTSFTKEIELIRFAQSYGSGDDYIKLYKRINNGAWEEIVLTIPTDDIILPENLSTVTDEFIDIQFKVEFHNEAQDNLPPLFHELLFDYIVTKK